MEDGKGRKRKTQETSKKIQVGTRKKKKAFVSPTFVFLLLSFILNILWTVYLVYQQL